MGVSRRSRVPERITRPDERFDSSQVGQSVPYCELFAGRSSKEQVGRPSLATSLRPARVGGSTISSRAALPRPVSGCQGRATSIFADAP